MMLVGQKSREHVASAVCRWCVCSCKLPHILVSLILNNIPPSFLPAVDARGVACAALQGTPFSSTHSSSTADLKRLQSLGEAAFSQTLSLLSHKLFTKYCKMCSYILDFRFPDRRKNWDLLQYFCFKNNCFLKQIIIFAPKNVPPLQLYLWQIWSILKTVFMNKALWSLCTKSQFANLHHILYEFTQLQNRSDSICWEAMRTKGWNYRSKVWYSS